MTWRLHPWEWATYGRGLWTPGEGGFPSCAYPRPRMLSTQTGHGHEREREQKHQMAGTSSIEYWHLGSLPDVGENVGNGSKHKLCDILKLT
jgi:hypothetical protein